MDIFFPMSLRVNCRRTFKKGGFLSTLPSNEKKKFHTVKCKVSQQKPIVGRLKVIHRKSSAQLSAKFCSKDPL